MSHSNPKNPKQGDASTDASTEAFVPYDQYERLQDRLENVLWSSSNSINELKQTQKRLEAELRNKQRLEQELMLSQKLEAVGQLAAGIAHEINTPLQYIGDNAHFLEAASRDVLEVLALQKSVFEADTTGQHGQDEVFKKSEEVDLGALEAEIPEAVQAIIEGVKTVSNLVRAMKEFSHPGVAKKTPTDINHAIEKTAVVCRNEWKYVAEFTTSFDETLPDVPCVPGELNQVILNILVNASHAISDVVHDATNKGTIQVRTRRCGEWAEMQFSDTGTGIPEDVKQRVFDPFFTTKEVGKGTGQGLAIARSIIVDKHGGTIDVESEAGKGTTFTVRLPLSGAQTL